MTVLSNFIEFFIICISFKDNVIDGRSDDRDSVFYKRIKNTFDFPFFKLKLWIMENTIVFIQDPVVIADGKLSCKSCG